jgi:hypothetical protein
MDPLRPFTEHPASVGESYGQHFAMAVCFGSRMILGGLACLVHGILPFMFVRTGSRAVSELNERMIAKRCRTEPAALASDQPFPL